tara:strand:+ start:1246 stop:1947 length:702 start_codon:yes stop_codon:yes gene_type:complete
MINPDNSIHIVAKITPKPEFFEQGLAALSALIQPTRAESGCFRFEVFADKPLSQYVLVEHFRSQSALDSHYAQPYTKRVFALYEEILAKAPEITILTPIEEASQSDGLSSRYDRGVVNLKRIDGRAGEEVVEDLRQVSESLANYVVEFPFGDIYNRGQIDLRAREIATIAMLAVIGDTEEQLKVHIHAGLNVGLSLAEIEEILIQTAVYAGFPRSINAMKVFAGIKSVITQGT